MPLKNKGQRHRHRKHRHHRSKENNTDNDGGANDSNTPLLLADKEKERKPSGKRSITIAYCSSEHRLQVIQYKVVWIHVKLCDEDFW